MPELMTRPTILLNPGPVTLTERVRGALVREDQCHREPEFAAVMLDIKRRLVRVYPDAQAGFDAVTLTGSGTCAVEAMLASLAPSASATLVVANGVYGRRMASMITLQGKPLDLVESDWIAAMNVEKVERRLATNATITHVAAVHNETTTGRLNDIATLGKLCRKHGRCLLLDAVSSFGGERIDFDAWNLTAVAGTANKCLHGVPGAAFVLARKSVLQQQKSHAQSCYLDLFRYHKDQETGLSPFTQAVHAFYALHEALMELESAGGWTARNARYRELSDAIGRVLNEHGVRHLLHRNARSSMISAFRLPAGATYQHLHDRMREAGFVIYAGQGHLQESIFRIANMGDIRQIDLERLEDAIRHIFGNPS